MQVISYMDGDGVQHFRLDQVYFQHLALSHVCHQGFEVMGSVYDHCLNTHLRPPVSCTNHGSESKQWLHSGGQSNTHVSWFLTCNVCDVVEPLQLWTDGIYINIQ
jgi:hypothetical protein